MTTSGIAVCSHAEYARQVPDHAHGHGHHNCPGTIRQFDQTEPHLLCACDTCGFEVAIRKTLPATPPPEGRPVHGRHDPHDQPF